MLKITQTISFPETWQEVVWKDYVKYYDLSKRRDDYTDWQYQAEALAIFAKTSVEQIKQLDQPERVAISVALNKLMNKPFPQIPDGSFIIKDPKTKKTRIFQFRIGSFAQIDRMEELSNLNPIDPIAPFIATYFVEKKEPEKKSWWNVGAWLERIYKSVSKTESNKDLEGYAERLGFIENLSVAKVQAMFFFSQAVWKTLENRTTEQFLSGLILTKRALTNQRLTTLKPYGIRSLSPIAWLKYGIVRLTMFTISLRLKSLISSNTNILKTDKSN